MRRCASRRECAKLREEVYVRIECMMDGVFVGIRERECGCGCRYRCIHLENRGM